MGMAALHPEPRPLVLHPRSTRRAVTRVIAGAERHAEGLTLYFAVLGRTGAIVLPEGEQLERRDELWRSTCFEAFVRAGDDNSYLEFNFSPANYWAAYEFDGYRQGMRSEDMIDPDIDQIREDDRLIMIVGLTDGQVMELPADRPWRIGLSAVIEETNGKKSYWALAHPPGKPDFHHADGFVLELP